MHEIHDCAKRYVNDFCLYEAVTEFQHFRIDSTSNCILFVSRQAYVEELKKSLLEMAEQRDAALEQKRQTHVVEKQQREVRFQVMEDFLQLRARNEPHSQRWAAILATDNENDGEAFSLTMPLTHFQIMVGGNDDNGNGEQVLKGVKEIMTDSQYFAGFLQSLASGSEKISFTYHCDRSNFMMDGCNGMLNWTASTVGRVRGALFCFIVFLCIDRLPPFFVALPY